MAANPLARADSNTFNRGTLQPGTANTTRPRGPRDRVIPNWIGTTDPSGQLRPGASVAIGAASEPREIQAQTLAEDAFIPIIYGAPERIAGMPYIVCSTSGGAALLVAFILCEGEVDAINNVEIDDAAPAAGILVTIYKGTAGQAADPQLVASLPGFAETLANTAYIVARFPAGQVTGFPKLTAEVSGLRIPDGRSGDALGPWDNPALILAHFMRTYARRTVNQASVNAAANFCDALVGDIKRARLTITLAESRDVNDWIEALRGYLPAWVVYKDGEWHITLDTTGAPVLAYDADTDNRTDGAAPMVLAKRGARDVPNVVEVSYTETSVKPWTTRKATATLPGLGVGERRKTTVSLPGIRTHKQAYRFAVERLNHYTLETIEGELAVMDDGIRLLPGDLVSLTDSAHGFESKAVRVLRVEERDNGRWGLRFREFFPAAYSTDNVSGPAVPTAGTLPNPTTVPNITGLAASESLKFENNALRTGGVDQVSTGLVWTSRIEATWDASADPFFDFFEISLQSNALAQPSVSHSRLAQFSSAPLVQGTPYTLQVRQINSLGFVGAWSSVVVNVLGKQTPPGDVTVIDFAAEVGGEVILRWRAVNEPDIVRYEIRAIATAGTTAPWNTMTLLDRPDTNYTRIKGIAPGATLFAIKAIDSTGRYSVNPIFVNLVITSDASSFLQNFDFTPQVATSTNLVQQDFPLVEGGTNPLPRWITKGNAFWNAALPNPVASANTPVVNAWGRNAAFTHRCDVFDMGLVLEVTVSLNLNFVKATRGTPRLYVLYSLDGSTYFNDVFFDHVQGVVPGYKSFKFTARYIKLEWWSNANTDALIIEGKINAQISSQSRKESGTGTSVASGGTRVNLALKYTKAVSITITPKGTAALTSNYDNVTVGLAVTPNFFDVYIFNTAGVQQGLKDFAWTFAGV